MRIYPNFCQAIQHSPSAAKKIQQKVLPFLLFISLILPSLLIASNINSVSISKTHFNPNVGESVELRFQLNEDSIVTAEVIDRDGYPIATLADKKSLKKGFVGLKWSGLAEVTGLPVPDDAYSFRVESVSRNGKELFFPAEIQNQHEVLQASYYDRKRGVLSYDLFRPSRVHVTAILAKYNEAEKKYIGPIVKTICNRVPRAAGAVIERWNGYAEGSDVYVGDHPDLRVSIIAEQLPQQSVLAIGNTKERFVDFAVKRKGKSRFNNRERGSFHSGLSSLEDTSPKLVIEPLNACWSASEKSWFSKDEFTKIRSSLTGTSSESFRKLPTMLTAYVGTDPVVEESPSIESPVLQIPTSKLSGNQGSLLTINWDSHYGPVTASAMQIKTSHAPADCVFPNEE